MAWSTRAPAKINLSLRMRGLRPDGYHLVHTVLQSIALGDRLTLRRTAGPFSLTCDAPGVPTDDRNLAWKGAVAMASALSFPLDGLSLQLEKHVPHEAGLGGGSADAVAAARLIAAAAGASLTADELAEIARPLGADVAYFAVGGTALGEGIGDQLTALADEPAAQVVLVRPSFGVSTREAYGWYDETAANGSTTLADDSSFGNDLEAPVVLRHPAIGAIVERLREAGARLAAMSGSGSACFGVFEPGVDVTPLTRGWADGTRVWVTSSLSRRAYGEATAVEDLA